MTLRWVNKERAAVDLPPLKRLPPGEGSNRRACRIANAFADAGRVTSGLTSIDYGSSIVLGKRKNIPLYASFTAIWFDFVGWVFHGDEYFTKDKLETLYKKPKTKKEKPVIAKKAMNKTDRKVLEIQGGLVEVQEQITALEQSFMHTSQDLRKRLRALEQEKREAEEEIYS